MDPLLLAKSSGTLVTTGSFQSGCDMIRDCASALRRADLRMWLGSSMSVSPWSLSVNIGGSQRREWVPHNPRTAILVTLQSLVTGQKGKEHCNKSLCELGQVTWHLWAPAEWRCLDQHTTLKCAYKGARWVASLCCNDQVVGAEKWDELLSVTRFLVVDPGPWFLQWWIPSLEVALERGWSARPDCRACASQLL